MWQSIYNVIYAFSFAQIEMRSINGASFVKGDFREEIVKQKIKNMLQLRLADMVAW